MASLVSEAANSAKTAVASPDIQTPRLNQQTVSRSSRRPGMHCADGPAAVRCRRRRSFALDTRRLDDRPPLLDLCFLQSGKRLRCLAFGCWNLGPEVAKPGPHCRISQGLDQ